MCLSQQIGYFLDVIPREQQIYSQWSPYLLLMNCELTSESLDEALYYVYREVISAGSSLFRHLLRDWCAAIRVEPRCWCFWRLFRKRLTIDAITHTFSERSFRDLSGNVWVTDFEIINKNTNTEGSTLIVATIIANRQKNTYLASMGQVPT